MDDLKPKKALTDLYVPGIYDRGLQSDQAARDHILDATYEAYSKSGGDMNAASKAFKRSADGYAISRKP